MKIKIAGIMLLFLLLAAGCSINDLPKGFAQQEETKAADTGYQKATAGHYDSADTAVVVKRNEKDKTITLLNIVKGKNYTLHYDGATEITDKYKQSMALAQVNPGDIVDVTFMKVKKRLNSISLSKQAWSYEDVAKFSLGRNNKSVTLGQKEYELDENVLILSNGGQAELMDLHEVDTLVVKGIDSTVYSIAVENGHGYLRLVNDEYFIGGWIEVGQALIQPVTEGMLLVVPEGSYQVLLTNKGIEGTKEVSIQRDGEVELDVGDIQAVKPKYGKIVFSLTPSDAVLYIDGEKADITQAVSLEYGIHQMIIKADGYQTITQYLKVGQEFATLNIEMEQKQEETKQEETLVPGVSANTISSNNTVTSTIPNAESKVHIDAPEGAEVYLNGIYLGTAPVQFVKTAGTHVIILRKDGYQTKSYTLQLDSEKKDISYSFADLVKSIGNT